MTRHSIPGHHRPAPSGEGLDFGYHWVWTYGHLLVAGPAAGAASAAAAFGGPMWLGVLAAAIAAWSLAGFLIARFVIRVNEPRALPTEDFLASGRGRVIDLGCGSGRASLMVAIARPESTVVAVDNFSADYIRDNEAAHIVRNTRIAGVGERVTVQRGDMRELPFSASEFDAAVSSFAIDHLSDDDVRRTLHEVRRVVRQDGDVLLWVIVPNLWLAIALPPAFLHGWRRARFWRDELAAAGFELAGEGTKGGMYWLLAR